MIYFESTKKEVNFKYQKSPIVTNITQKRINERALIPEGLKPGRTVKPFNTHRHNVTSNRNRTTKALLSEEKSYRKDIRDTKK